MKLRIFLIFTLLLSLTLTGCQNGNSSASDTSAADQPSEGVSSSDEAFTEAADHLYTEWKTYLSTMEEDYKAISWTYDYIEDYLETDAWKDLSQARTACILFTEYIQGLTIPEDELTDHEYEVLSSAGADTSMVPLEFSTLSDSLNEDLKHIRYALFQYLEDYNTISTMEAMEKRIPIDREILEAECQYDALTTNYLLLQLFDESTAQDYMTELKSEYPVIFQNYDTDNLLSTDKAQTQASSVQDNIENVLNPAEAEVVEELSSATDEYNDALMSNDLETLSAISSNIIDMPQLLLCPAWSDCSVDNYSPYTIENKQITNLTYPVDLDETEIYGCVKMTISSESSVEDYITELTAVGYHVKEESEENTWTVTLEDYSACFNVEDDVMMFLFYPQDVTFTDNPCLYKSN